MISVCADFASLSRAAAMLFVQKASAATAQQGRFAVAFAGGHTPKGTYELLAAPPFRDQVPWEKVHAFLGDERCVPAENALSNAAMLRQTLLDRVPLPASQFHPIDCAGNGAEAARRYESALRRFFGSGPIRFDLVLLGLGEDGHTASLFPGTEALEEQEHWVAPVLPAGQDLHRVTLTAPAINRAAAVAFLVSGSSKAGALQRVLRGPRAPREVPAQLIAPTQGELLWLVDREAAHLLGDEPTRGTPWATTPRAS